MLIYAGPGFDKIPGQCQAAGKRTAGMSWETLCRGWDGSWQFVKTVTNHRISKVWRKMIFHKENDGNFYNCAGNTISLKEHGSFILWEKLVYLQKICGFSY